MYRAKAITMIIFAASMLFACAAFAIAAGAMPDHSDFEAKFEKAIAASGLGEAERGKARANTENWLADCKYLRLGEFLDMLTDADVAEIVATAAHSRLVSDRDVPVAEDPAAYGQATLLSLPVDGVWNIVQGNNGIVSHLKGEREEFAWDFVIVNNGQQAVGNANVNETHNCWGQPVRTPAPGTVAFVKDDLDDHPPYTPDPPHVGNHVYIDHGNGELSLLYHLKKGSALVKVGDVVERGQPVGLCGDTGISMFPHLHFVFYKGTVQKHERMPTRFSGYFSFRKEYRPGELLPEKKLRLSGVPKRLEYVVNAAAAVELNSKK